MALRRRSLLLISLFALATASHLGCGNAAAEQAVFQKTKALGGFVEFRGDGPEIHFNDAKISDADLACLQGLPHIHLLDLTNTNTTDACLDHVLPLNGLKAITIRGTKITEDGIHKLEAKFPGVRINR